MPSWSAALQAQINAATYHNEAFTFTRYCEHYIVGYSTHGVQIIKGKCHYGGVRDLAVNAGGHYPGDLPSFIRGLITGDLPAEIIGLRATATGDLGGIVGGHLPGDLGSIVDIHGPENLLAYIRGFDFRDLGAVIGVMIGQDLPSEIFAIPPEDLPAYLKVWPQEDLPGYIYGWDTKDLTAYVNMIAKENLSAIIGGHRPSDIRAQIKGWVREATYDLGGFLHGFDTDDLNAFIRATSMAQLPAYLFPVQPEDLSSFIYGWDTKDLQAIINGAAYPWDLPASIIGNAWKIRDLGASLTPDGYLGSLKNLSAYTFGWGTANLTAALVTVEIKARDLGAFVDSKRRLKNLPASIYPKKIRLTGILSMITMEHSDLSATISIPCFYSNLKDLPAYLNPVFKADLGAYIYPKNFVWGEKNLGASFGYTLNTVVQDKLTINLSIDPVGFRTEDKYSISLSIFRSGLSLGATITPQRLPVDLSAYINAVNIVPYDFETWKGNERVISRNYTQVIQDYEDVDISFKTIVKDYFYSSGSDVVAKVDRYTHFVTKVASYYSPATSRRLDRKLHKIKYLYDMSHFDTIDEAMRYAIWYVTTYPESDLGAYINVSGEQRNMTASINITGKSYSNINNLTSNILGESTRTYDVVVGYTDDGVGFLQF